MERRNVRPDRAEEPAFVLVHSPFATPVIWHWVAQVLEDVGYEVVVPSIRFETDEPPDWERCVDAVVATCATTARPLVLVGHGGIGPFVPTITQAMWGRVANVVFVETALPPFAGYAVTSPPWLRDEIGYLAIRGRLPTWSKWWRARDMEVLVPDPERRRIIEDDLPELIPSYFNHRIPVPEGWSERLRCSYLWFSDTHRGDAAEAARRGWQVLRLSGEHLHMVVQPEEVAQLLLTVSGDR